MGVTLASTSETVVFAGNNWFSRLVVFGAFAAVLLDHFHGDLNHRVARRPRSSRYDGCAAIF